MTKPTFILFFGIGWCGTTSLYNTLRANKYFHGGWTKEPRILRYIDRPELVRTELYNHNYKLKNKIKHVIDEARNYPLNECDDYIRVLSKIPVDLEDAILDSPTLEQYVEYYKILSDNRYPYHAVGDFSNANLDLSKEFLIKLKSALEEHFTVKVLGIHRDPVRSRFSRENSYYFNHSLLYKTIHEKYSSIEDLFLSSISRIIPKTGIENYHTVFGKENCHHVIMEKFFIPDRDEVSLLENFLDYKLPIIAPCVFVPDKGINPPKLEGLKDQWSSDHKVLTPELYNTARELFDEQYQYDKEVLFKDRLPAEWGKPIDYGY